MNQGDAGAGGFESVGDVSRETTIDAADAVAGAVRTTLGPKGLDKLVVADGKLIVTNDGASVLSRLEIDDPVARVLVETATEQDGEQGDGATTAVVLAASLLREAGALLERGLHPTTVTNGYALAMERARTELESIAVDAGSIESGRFRDVAGTTVTGKWDGEDADRFAELAVGAIRAIESADGGAVDRDRLTLTAFSGGSLSDSELLHGVVIDLERSSTSLVSPDVRLPRTIEDATVALIDAPLTVETPQGVTHLSLETPEQRAELQEYEDDLRAEYVTALDDAGVDAAFCQKSIDDPVRYLLAKEGIVPVERTRQDELHTLSRVTGASLVRSVEGITGDATGTATVERRDVGAREVVVVDTPESDHHSLLLRGGTPHVAEETERIVRTCLRNLSAVVTDPRVVPGGGAPEAALARSLRSYAAGVEGREQLAVEAFADAMEAIPRMLATTAGMDPTGTMIDLRSAQHGGEPSVGIDATAGRVADVLERGIVDPLTVRRRALEGAVEAATLLLRVDGTLAASGEDGGEEEEEHDHGTHARGDPGGYPWAIGH